VAVLLAACALPALALPPNISNRSYVQVPYTNYSYNWWTNTTITSYVQPTAVAAGTAFALVGSGNPRLHDILDLPSCLTCGDGESATYYANPVIVTDPPWAAGTPFATHKTIDPPVHPNGAETFGTSLAIHANRVAVGSPEVIEAFYYVCCYDSEEAPYLIVSSIVVEGGRVHLYQYNGTEFLPERTIVYGGQNERFGTAIDLDATHLLVGRPGPASLPGAADLFDPATGNLITTFTSPSTYDGFGETVALAGDLALVGARDQAIVYVYRHDGAGTWNPAGQLTSPGSGSKFGAAISADGERILVGAPSIDRAFIFEDDGDSDWPVVAELSGGASSKFGTAVALVGDSAFVGAPELLFGSIRTGLVARHDRAGDGTWPFVTHVSSRQQSNNDRFGKAIAASPTMLTVVENRLHEMSVFTAPPGGGC